MKPTLTLLVTAALLTTAHAQSTLKQDLQNHYNAFSDAVSSKNAKFFDTYFQPGFTVTFPNHETKNRDDVLHGINDLLEKGSRLHWTVKVVELHMAADGVLAKTESHLSARMKGDDKKTHRVEIDGINNDTWTQANNQWVLKHIEVTHLAVKVDGKPIALPNNDLTPAKP